MVAGQVNSDLDVIYAATGTVVGDSWLNPPPAAVQTPSVLAHSQAMEEIAPGILSLTNVAGYNLMAVDLGQCFAVFDAPANYDQIQPLPSRASVVDRSQLVMDALHQRAPEKSVCYVIPTHPHSDHLGSIRRVGALRSGTLNLSSFTKIESIHDLES